MASAGVPGCLATGLGERGCGGSRAAVGADLPRLAPQHRYPALVGPGRPFPNGVGKTTLLKMILGEEQPDPAQITGPSR